MLAAQRAYGAEGSVETMAGAAFGQAFGNGMLRPCVAALRAIGRGRYHLVADIRLDNRDELLSDLGPDAASAAHDDDASLLLRAWMRWREATLERLVGDFAFALFDQAERRLTLARDHTGQRPLFFARQDGFVAFSSMPSGLLACPLVRTRFDYPRLAAMLVGIPDSTDATYFAGIHRVLPGHSAIFSAASHVQRSYWSPPRSRTSLSDDDYVDGYRTVLNQAVAARLPETPGALGVHLSSGYDSGAVAATAARLSGRTRPIAFTSAPRLDFDGPVPRGRIADESTLAALTAERYGMEHVVIRPTGGVLGNLRRHAQLYQQPDRNIINMEWWSAILGAARDRGISTMLTGQAGNMTLHAGGLTSLADLIGAGEWFGWWREARAAAARSDVRWRGVLLNSFQGTMPPALVHGLKRLFKGTPNLVEQSFVRDHWLDGVRRSEHATTFVSSGDSYQNRLDIIRTMDVGVFRKGALAEAGIDERDPLADRRVIDFSFTLPPHQMLRHGVSRPLARRALTGILPAETLDSKLRGYQGADWYERLTQADAYAVLEEVTPNAAVNELLDVRKIRRAIEHWPRGDWAHQGVKTIYRNSLTIALSTAVFLSLHEPLMAGLPEQSALRP